MRKKAGLIIKILFFCGLFLISGTIAYFFRIYKNIVVTTPGTKQTTPAPTPTPDPLRIRNILLLGYAGGDHDGAALTDTIILARIYPKDKKIVLLSIPRDIWVPVPISKESTQHFKINHAFAIGIDDKKYPDKDDKYKGLYGAGTLSKEMISIVTGIMPENFAAINFSGFTSIVDSFGGIEVNIPFSFEDKYYPIKGLENDICGKSEEELESLHATMSGQLLEKEFTCRYETLNFQKGYAALDGETALKFVRSRHSDINGNDFGRALRQQAFLIGVKNKLLKIGSIPKILTSVNTLSKNILTDVDVKTALEIASEQETLSDFEIKSLSLTTDNVLMESQSSDHQYILISKDGIDNWESVHQYIKENI
ncbi:MAG: cell envelope-related transcriptional attenuator [Candidatus Woesebacteria bacterium GW2011_GWC1_38_13]|uniref:Cell envelope-related transcriptional attenuator n=3 Tax=Candidatus Woeseibacteriota TaxID=1752722 RepID=A0A0G0NBT5_9BACT|nr:MAG: cell envelope-related transcriptional attenuator [Candidatus Woesebacteria bacterium GW2011_GWC1_38_13]KKQ83359.1 MAG: Cell envelope-related transcriptional attenuator [Candidatus Woesebacteria bacterium GW2011_GWA1_38_8]